MNDEVEPAARRRKVRCPEGHIFDAAAQDSCPVCGARPAAKGATQASAGAAADKSAEPSPSPAPTPAPPWLALALAGAALLFVVLVVALMMRRPAVEPEANADRPAAPSIENADSRPARDSAPDPAKKAAGIAGSWEIYVPLPQGTVARWTIVFDAAGKYRFTDESNGASHSGTYQSANGQWSLSGSWSSNPLLAPGTRFDDNGAYRLIDADTLELQGRYGVGVWKRAR